MYGHVVVCLLCMHKYPHTRSDSESEIDMRCIHCMHDVQLIPHGEQGVDQHLFYMGW